LCPATRNESFIRGGPQRQLASTLGTTAVYDQVQAMTPVSRPLSIFYFFSGLLVGLIVGMSLDKQWTVVVTRFISAGVIIILSFFWRRIESYSSKRYLDTWSTHRARGKWRFIFIHYVFIRGLILLVVFAGPMLPSFVFTTLTVTIIGASIIALVLLLIYLGHETWTTCEQDYEILVLRQAAQQARIASN
jgi:hypothetical protein